jgi:oligoendopeptidase F
MTVLYPGLESPEFEAGFAAVTQNIADLATLFDQHEIAQRPNAALDTAAVAAFDEVTARYNEVLDQTITLSSYIWCFITTDSRDTLAQAKMSQLRRSIVALEQLGTRFTSWIGSLDLAALQERSALAREHNYPLRRAQQSARHLMSPAEETLASELGLNGAAAWKQLYVNVTSQLSVAFERDGRTGQVPMSVIRNYAYDADRNLRRQAHEAELQVWRNAAVPLAAALNGVKGEVITLCQRRGWASPLDESLFVSGIDRATLDAMFSAARESLPDLRRYFRAKARAIGVEQLAWYDIFAPLGASRTVWEYETATRFIVQQFGAYSDRLGDFAARAFREGWIDAEPRPAKRDGAFCERLRRGESRILANYEPSFVGLNILAHELGHAYHELNLIDRTALQSRVPETLAETASIFCETIIAQAALRHADRQEQIAILNTSLQSSAQRVISVTSRFLFEQRIFEQRQQRELAIDEFCALMQQAQRDTYGDGLDQNALHPYLWAAKIHYYYPNLSFYNYPYMFGLLFSLGLYARYQRDPERFKTGYDALLSATGLADAATLAERFGIDIRTPEFWQASLAVIRADVDRFEQLIG